MYKFAHIRTTADITDPEHTLGIEVTIPELAARCGLGNIDGQHGTGICWRSEMGASSDRWAGRAAIDIATEIRLPIVQPPALDAHGNCPTGSTIDAWLRACGASGHTPTAIDRARFCAHGWTGAQIDAELANGRIVLATVRPDLDSIGAMAALILRQLGWVFSRDDAEEDDLRNQNFSRIAAPSTYGRIRRISGVDSFRPAAEWAPSPLPTVECPWSDRPGPVDATEDLAFVDAICSSRPGEQALPLGERVAVVACWLLWGHSIVTAFGVDDLSARKAHAAAIYAACSVERAAYIDTRWRDEQWDPYTDALEVMRRSRARVDASRRALAGAVRQWGAVRIHCATCGAHWEAGTSTGCPLDAGPSHHRDSVAVVRVAHAGALGLGYCVAPVVVAFDQATPSKVTIAAYGPQYVDMAALKERLNDAEAEANDDRDYLGTWGGPPLMCLSPQKEDVRTRLSEQTIIDAVLASVRGAQ